MRKVLKMVTFSFVLAFCCMIGHSYATTTTPAYNGVLIDYLQAEKTAIGDLFDTTYTAVYTAFAKTGLNIVKSVEYQGLVCLGAINDEGLLYQLQKDKIAFKVDFNKDFVELEKRVVGLEEKKRLQEENNISMFDSGTSYESEKARLKAEIDTKAQTYRTLIANFSTEYTTEITKLVTDFQSYLSANQQLLAGIKNKMANIQKVSSGFEQLDVDITTLTNKITGLELLQKIEISKTKGLTALDSSLQSLIATNIKKYKRLQTFTTGLTQQKVYVLGQYEMDIDEYVSNSLKNRYDRSQYLTLKTDVDHLLSLYYTSNKQLNCTNILSTRDTGASLLPRIAAMQIAVQSGLSNIEKYGITSAVKDQIYSGFQLMYVQKFKQRYTEYATYLKNYIALSLKNLVASTTNTETTAATQTSVQTTPTIVFTKPFKSGQYSEDIKALQNVLTTVGFYSGAIDGVYSAATKAAVYQFQLSKGLLKGYENRIDVRGYFGPATRKAINALNK